MFKKLFAWWDDATLGTLLFTRRKGRLVGEDEQGNRYYEERKTPRGRSKRRWVIYAGTVEASRVPPDWHGWLHHTFAEPPTAAPLPRKAWERPHRANLSGTVFAWRPRGALSRSGKRAHATGDYDAWTPQ